VVPFLFYPFAVILYWATLTAWKTRQAAWAEREVILEQRSVDVKRLLFLLGLPIGTVFGIIIYCGLTTARGDNFTALFLPLFGRKTFVLGAFSAGSFLLMLSLIGFRLVGSLFRPAEVKDLLNTAARLRKGIIGLSNKIASSGALNSSDGFIGGQDLPQLATRFTFTSLEKEGLESIAFYYRYPMGDIPTRCKEKLRRIADAVREFWEDFLKGMKGIAGTAAVLVAALAFKEVIASNGGYFYPSGETCKAIMGWLPLEFAPPLLLVLATLIGLVIGTAWGTFAVSFPFLLILKGISQGETHLLNLSLAALISAAVFVNQSSEQADNVVITSQYTGVTPREVLRFSKRDRWICYGEAILLHILSPFLHPLVLIPLLIPLNLAIMISEEKMRCGLLFR